MGMKCLNDNANIAASGVTGEIHIFSVEECAFSAFVLLLQACLVSGCCWYLGDPESKNLAL